MDKVIRAFDQAVTHIPDGATIMPGALGWLLIYRLTSFEPLEQGTESAKQIQKGAESWDMEI